MSRVSEAKQRFFLHRLINVTIFFTVLICFGAFVPLSYSATYYVATNGRDGDPGASEFPFRTIQKCLGVVQPGGSCVVRAGTYYEALVLKTSGTNPSRITLQNYSGETVTVNSGDEKALRTDGRRHYYTIDGLRFISNHVNYGDNEYSIDFEDGVWDGATDPNGGNNGFIVKNCYIEGMIHFYGHYNTVENCELNGKSLWGNGIYDNFAASHHNTYRKNTIYNYRVRGVWTMQSTDSVVIEDNTIHDIGGGGIDCDGAAHPIYNSVVRGNTIYSIGGRGIEMENGFNSIVEKNIIRDCQLTGIHYINYGFGPDFYSDAEYRTANTNGTVRNNLVYNTLESGIRLTGSAGNKIYANTIYKNSGSGGYYAAIALTSYGGYHSQNADIRDNIVLEGNPYALWIEQPSSGPTGLQMSNNLYYHSSNTKTHFIFNIGSYTLEEYKSLTGLETNSIFSNPGFVSPASNDFHLTSTSPAIDAGIALAEVTDDLEGIARPQGAKYDIGAYEFTRPRPKPPRNLRIVH